MRLRKVKHAEETIKEHPDKIVEIPRGEKVDLKSRIDNRPLDLEIGAGKGQFIHNLSAANPGRFYLAVERYDSVIVRALEKFIDEPRENVLLVQADAQMLKENLEPSSVDTIYLNFSDPWPKVRHAKRRLTHPRFLNLYRSLLKPKGILEFKTDNRNLFEYTLETMNGFGVDFKEICLDLHKEYDKETLFMTEFEERFSKEGPIYKLTATFKEDKTDEENL